MRMRAGIFAALSARVRIGMVSLCVRLGGACLWLSARLVPPPTLSPDADDRMLAGILARIAEPTYQPSTFDRACAEIAYAHQDVIVVARVAGRDIPVMPAEHSRRMAGRA
jgi:hypothetical protein